MLTKLTAVSELVGEVCQVIPLLADCNDSGDPDLVFTGQCSAPCVRPGPFIRFVDVYY